MERRECITINRDGRPESGQHRSELRPANADGLLFMLTQRNNGIYHQLYNCWQTNFLYVGFKCHERHKTKFHFVQKCAQVLHQQAGGDETGGPEVFS